MSRLNLIAGTLAIALLICGCSGSKDKDATHGPDSVALAGPARFTLMPASQTGVKFKNILQENAQISYFDNPYIYNGGGVAVGDINNDGLPDLYFVSNLFSNKLYLNKGNLTFEDISAKAGVEASRGFKTGVAMVDVNADGWLDIYVCRSHHPDGAVRADFVYINNKDLTFTERARALGLDDTAFTTHVAFFDFDRDGDLDIYQLNHPNDFDQGVRVRLRLDANQNLVRRSDPESPDHSDHLYRNRGDGTFEDISRKAGILNSAFGLSTSVTDINADGYPDIYVANDFIEPDLLYVNNRDGTFSDQLFRHVRHTSQNSMGSDMADFNNDGLEDLVTVDMLAETNERQKLMTTSMVLDRYETLIHYGYGHQLMRNVLQVNNGNGTFSDIAWLAGVSATEWSWSSLFADFDNDGHKDLFISNGIRRDMTDSEYIQFKRDTMEQLNKTGAPLVTAQTMQKWLDRMPQVKVHNYMYHNQGNLRFKDVSQHWGFGLKTFSNGTVYTDLDLDGDLDLVMNDLDSTVLIYRNETDKLPSPHNFLQFAFSGPAGNPFGVGAKVTVYTGGQKQIHEVKVSRGFLSSVEPVLHFGLGSAPQADSALVEWPDGKQEPFAGLPANQRLTVNHKNAKPKRIEPVRPAAPRLQRLLAGTKIREHRENKFNDFEYERLLPHKFSESGPALSVADVTGDGLDDIFCGGAKGVPGVLLIQSARGDFREAPQEVLMADSVFEDVASVFFDADNDRDMDLLVVSGGYEPGPTSPLYQPRLYLNQGQGAFARSNQLPLMRASGGCVTVGDYDRDGDADVFIGGRVVPGSYGKSPASYLLRNDKGVFTDVTESVSPNLKHVGMISSAQWADINGDGYVDLLLVGEWMPVTLLLNEGGKSLRDASEQWGLKNSEGWWNCIKALDLDDDGDMDLVTGNLGLNSLLKASPAEPMELYAADFDGNGSDEGIICSYLGGKSWPLPRRELMVQQIPSLKKKFVRFEKYSKATIDEVFDKDKLGKALHLKAFMLTSSVWLNQQGKFTPLDLPIEAQVSPVNTFVSCQLNDDNLPDLLLAGNTFGMQVELGRIDAGHGLALINEGGGRFRALSVAASGLFMPGEVRHGEPLQLAGKQAWVFAENNGPLYFFGRSK